MKIITIVLAAGVFVFLVEPSLFTYEILCMNFDLGLWPDEDIPRDQTDN